MWRCCPHHPERRSDLLQALQQLDEDEDINKVLRYFSYEHFYVIYCKVGLVAVRPSVSVCPSACLFFMGAGCTVAVLLLGESVCQFWELDSDHDFFISKEDLLRYGNHSLTYRIVDRIFSQASAPAPLPASITLLCRVASPPPYTWLTASTVHGRVLHSQN
jgi:hypothetical protein